MPDVPAGSGQFLGQLPVEISRFILLELSDFGSLQSAILSCRTLYSAFTGDPSGIANQVLLNQVGVEVLPEAIAAFESSSLRPQSPLQEHLDFVARHFSSRSTHALCITPKTARFFAKLDVYVHKLSRMFAEDCLTKVPPSKTQPEAPSQAELARIRRALYRFETFCNLSCLPRSGVRIREEHLEKFFHSFSSCENEQLACIQHYLVRLVSPAFNEVAAHDVAWGEKRVEPAFNIDSFTIQGVLSLGLIALHHLGTAQSYEEKYAQLASENPPVRPEFLHRALSLASRAIAPDYSDGQAFFDDPNTGPAGILHWAHPNGDANSFYQPNRAHLREWGYVMWDQARIDQTKVCKSLWATTCAQIGLEQLYEMPGKEWRESWARRSEIYSRGGRGWWDIADESKIVW